jgi:hypothetical protein
MAIQYSFSKIAEQIITFNSNLVDTLSKLNQLVTTSEPSLTVNITDQSGVVSQFSLPSIGYLKSELDRLNNNINAIYNIDNGGALIQTSSSNRFRKVVTVNLNKEPADIINLEGVNTFVSSKNWFFEGLMNPLLSVEIDLSDKVDLYVRKVLSRRYIVEFSRNADGTFTPAGQSALNSFNASYRNNSSIELAQFQSWLATTPGVVGGANSQYDEQMFDLEPNQLMYTGDFTVESIEEDTVNRKLWYRINTLEYADEFYNTTRTLSPGDEVVMNRPMSTTKYRIIEVSTAESIPKIRLERTVGNEPVPVGVNVLKIYSPVMGNRTVRVSVGYNERCVIFLKPMNMDTFIMARNWSLGMGMWTNDLRLSSNDQNNGLSMEQYYVSEVDDYGKVLKDMVAKKTPNTVAVTPNAPVLNDANFKVVQINKHLTEGANNNELKDKNNQQRTLSSEIEQINDAINEKNRQLKVTRFASESAKRQFESEIERLVKTKETKANSLNSLTAEILNLSSVTIDAEDYKFRVRGFWDMPSAVVARGSRPQEVVQFIVEYRYLSTDGKETPVETFALDGDATRTAAFSNWNRMMSEPRQRQIDARTGEYSWVPQDIANPDAVNINQVDIPITFNERVEIRVKSISEAGWPESPVESDWSNTVAIDFPEELGNGLQQVRALITDANKEDIKAKIESDLQTRGLYAHLAENTTVNNKNYFHSASSVLSGFKDENGLALDLFEYLQRLEQRIRVLEDEGRRIKGELEVVIYRNSEQYVVKNGTEISFTVECEDYLLPYDAVGAPTGRVYANNIYQVKDFLIKIRNKVPNSPLGLFSNRTYINNPNTDIFNSGAPQVFWVNDQNELIYSNLTGETKTQADNQFLWSVNFDSLNQTTTNKLSDNVGNGFIAANNNSVTPILSSTEFNLGYSENSVLSFVGNNNSLLDVSKWIDTTVSVSSTTKLLTTIHPSTPRIQNIVETNADKVRDIDFGESNDINIPINIYFKMNALDPAQEGINYKYVDLNTSRTTVRHTKKVRFLMESDTDNRPFVFTVQFILNRNKVVVNRLVNPGPNRTISTDMPTTFMP